ELLLGLFLPGHVHEVTRGLRAGELACTALAERHRLVIGAASLAHHEDQDRAKDDQRQEVEHQAKEVAELTRPLDRDFDGARSNLDAAVAEDLLDGRGRFLAGRDRLGPTIEEDREVIPAYLDPIDPTGPCL